MRFDGRGVAQTVARTVRDREAAGSSPAAPTNQDEFSSHIEMWAVLYIPQNCQSGVMKFVLS